MIERLAILVLVAILIALAVVASSRKFFLHQRPQKALLESLAEHDPRCIGDGAVRGNWKNVQARYPDLPNYKAGRA